LTAAKTGMGNAQTGHRVRVWFQYCSSQPAHNTLCDKLPHNAH
jgi:hypothetical protein